MKIVLIYNPKSGSSKSLSQLRNLCKDAGIIIDYSFTFSQLKSKKLAYLIKSGVVVAAVGGDGTQNSVAALIIGSKSCLLPLPGGTLNNFISDMALPKTIEEALRYAPKAKIERVDVGYVNNQLFLNNSSVGLYPLSLYERKKTQAMLGKWPAAVRAVIKQILSFRRYNLLIDGVKIRSPFIFVGNNQYKFAKSGIPKRNSLNSGTLGVMIASPVSKFELLKIAAVSLRGKLPSKKHFDTYQSQKLRIDSHYVKLPVSIDGEVRKLDTPLIFSIEPLALRILCAKIPK